MIADDVWKSGAVLPETDERAEAEGARAIRSVSYVAAGVAVVLSPVPLADEVVLIPVYGWLTLRLARAHGLRFLEVPWTTLAKVAVLGLAARGSVSVTVSAMPGVSAAVNAATALGLTHVYGAIASRAVRDPMLAKTIAATDVIHAVRDALRRGWAA